MSSLQCARCFNSGLNIGFVRVGFFTNFKGERTSLDASAPFRVLRTKDTHRPMSPPPQDAQVGLSLSGKPESLRGVSHILDPLFACSDDFRKGRRDFHWCVRTSFAISCFCCEREAVRTHHEARSVFDKRGVFRVNGCGTWGTDIRYPLLLRDERRRVVFWIQG